MNNIKRKIKTLFPAFVTNNIATVYLQFKLIKFELKLKKIRVQQFFEVKRLQRKSKIKVVFFLILESIWKYEELYKLMAKSERFDPIIIVCPHIALDDETLLKELNKIYLTFTGKGYNVIKSYNEKTGLWLDVKEEIRPDIIFFTNSHDLTKEDYSINNFSNYLTCYVPYAFVVIHKLNMHYDRTFHHLLWKYYIETEYHNDFAKRIARNGKLNTVVTGYPSLDSLKSTNTGNKTWKVCPCATKKIIWAPHHTIEGQGTGLDYSSFQKYHQFFIELIKKRGDIQIAFKPHPLLKLKLYKDANWGKNRTDSYYNEWRESKNGQLEEGEYIDLFATSDAMIHDSASFMAEYLYLNKPSLFTLRDDSVIERFNDFGKHIFALLYHANSYEEILSFISNVVIEGNDSMYEQRLDFVERVITPPHNRSASENIFNDLQSELTC